jgi:hypothetical protein
MHGKSRPAAEEPVLITTARPSTDVEYEHRRRKYALMMSIRALAVIGAAAFYHVSIWISLVCLAAGAVLPWCAVIIANDGPPKKRAKVLGPVTPQDRALPPAPPSRTFEGTAEHVRNEEKSA